MSDKEQVAELYVTYTLPVMQHREGTGTMQMMTDLRFDSTVEIGDKELSVSGNLAQGVLHLWVEGHPQVDVNIIDIIKDIIQRVVDEVTYNDDEA